MKKLYGAIGWGGMVMVLVFSGCAAPPVKQAAYSESAKKGHYQARNWALDGRVALRSGNESWTAGVEWQLLDDEEMIRIIGPLGQGAVFIHVTDEYVDVDRGEGAVRYFDRSDDFVTEQLGFYVPLRSLRYWVMGLADPGLPSEEIINGFIQGSWRVLYRQMQSAGQQALPYRMDVSNHDVKLKLIIDKWNLHD